MQDSQTPVRVPAIWGHAAGTSYIRSIPTASQIGTQNGAASFTDGFPPLCFVPRATGGAPPFGEDFNGIFNQITAGLQWLQAGGPMPYDSAFSTAIGGYPKGAIIASSVTAGVLWVSSVENNTSNPDTGGANWFTLVSGRLLNIQPFFSSGTYNPTAGTKTAIIYGTGGGGAGGGTPACSSSQNAAGAGGGSAGYARAIYSNPTAQTVTIGVGGTGVAGANGNNGGSTSFGSLLTIPGGGGGGVGIASITASISPVGTAGASPSGSITLWVTPGQTGTNGLVLNVGVVLPQSGIGGSGLMGGGGNNTNNGAGSVGVGYGAGGSGAAGVASAAALVGGAGANGALFVEEFS